MPRTIPLDLLIHCHGGDVGLEAANRLEPREDQYRLTLPDNSPVDTRELGRLILTRLHAIDPERICVHFVGQRTDNEFVSLRTPDGRPVMHAPEWIDLLTELELIEAK